MNSLEIIISIIQKNGFSDFRIIDAKDIKVAQWVRVKCTFGCSDYGLGTCPPNTPTIEECQQFFNEYKTAVIIRLNVMADKQNYPSAWSKQMTSKLLEVERQLFLKGFYKVFLFNQTCCGICKDCSSSRIDCVDKKHARPSPEAFAVDVFETVRNAGFEINVINENPSEINRFAIIMVE